MSTKPATKLSPTFHHSNLGVREDGLDAQREFLEVLGFQRFDAPPELANFNVNWYRAGNGIEIHLSTDPDHSPAKRAHTAISYGDQLDALLAALDEHGTEYKVMNTLGTMRVAFCQDPNGNRWELRG